MSVFVLACRHQTQSSRFFRLRENVAGFLCSQPTGEDEISTGDSRKTLSRFIVVSFLPGFSRQKGLSQICMDKSIHSTDSSGTSAVHTGNTSWLDFLWTVNKYLANHNASDLSTNGGLFKLSWHKEATYNRLNNIGLYLYFNSKCIHLFLFNRGSMIDIKNFLYMEVLAMLQTIINL